MKSKPIVVNSPIEFIILGTINNERAILVKSNSAQVDLQSSLYKYIGYERFSPIPKIFFNRNKDLKPIQIDSTKFISNKVKPNEIKLPNNTFDRLDNLTFIWRGIQNKSNMELIQQTFDRNIMSIYKAYVSQDIETIEYEVSDLIFLCIESIRDKEIKIEKMRLIFLLLLTYLIFIGLYILYKSL
jgi:hypothetical protein